MADLKTAESGYETGAIDTHTDIVNDPGGDAADADHVNHLASGVVAIQTVLGVGTTLKGTQTDLVARLAIALETNGKLKDFSATTKTTFPGSVSEGCTGNTTFTTEAPIVFDGTKLASQSANLLSFPGEIRMYGAATPPSGWLECDGTAVSRTTYASLFAVVGTSFGVGDGSTTFNLPDMRSRSPIGVGTGSGLTARTLGTTYGAENFTLAEANLASHSHVQQYITSNGGGLHAAYSNGTTGGETAVRPPLDQGSSTANAASNVTMVTQSVGSGTAKAHQSPSLGVHFIIKT